jgi:predicted neuraminidase
MIRSEFIYDADAPTPSCHASTIAETKEGLAAAWFGGTAEGKKDVGIWVSLYRENAWSKPVEVATGAGLDGAKYPCWNPVLFQYPDGPLVLFYKVGLSPRTWSGLAMESHDSGKTWGEPWHLPAGMLGPIKNKPVRLPDGSLLCPSSTEDARWRVHMESTTDVHLIWTKTDALNDPKTFGVIQPTILDHGPAGIQILCRSQQHRIVESWSHDGGHVWDTFTATSLPNPNSGIDAVLLKDGRSLLIYNNSTTGRSPLNVAVSDDGKIWKAGPVLETEAGEFSYPAVIQTSEGLVQVTYTWKRKRIKHVVLDPTKFELRDLPPLPK